MVFLGEEGPIELVCVDSGVVSGDRVRSVQEQVHQDYKHGYQHLDIIIMLSLGKRVVALHGRLSFSFCAPFLGAAEAGRLHGQALTKFIDCRDPNEYAAQHIQGAVHVNEIFAYLARSDEQGKEVM